MLYFETVLRLTALQQKRTHVEHKEDILWWQAQGLMPTATGYGSKIPTTWKVKHNNRWKRVYCRVFSNIGSLYILSGANEIAIDTTETGASL